MPVLPSLTSAMEEIKRLNDQLEKTKRLYQEMVDAALQWREKFVRLEGQANAISTEALRAANIAEELANQNASLEAGVKHNAEVGLGWYEKFRAAEAQIRTLQGRVRMFETSESSTIGDLQSQLEEARKRNDIVAASYADACNVNGNLRAEIHRKDKDLRLLRSELERSRVAHDNTAEEFDKVRMNFRHTATEVNEAYLRGRRDGQSERDNAAMLANDDAFDRGRLVGRAEVHAAVTEARPDFLNRAIDLHDLLHEISEEDPHAVQFRVRNPAMTGQIVALTHALRDFHNAPCPSSEG